MVDVLIRLVPESKRRRQVELKQNKMAVMVLVDPAINYVKHIEVLKKHVRHMRYVQLHILVRLYYVRHRYRYICSVVILTSQYAFLCKSINTISVGLAGYIST